MTEPTLILLGEPRPRLTIETVESGDSPITGRPLRRLRVQTGRIPEDEHDRLRAELRGDGAEQAAVLDDSGGRWLVTSNSYSYSDSGQITLYDHAIDLEEDEIVSLESIGFEGLTLLPTRYEIKISSDQLVVEVLVDVDEDTHEEIERLARCFRGAGVVIN